MNINQYIFKNLLLITTGIFISCGHSHKDQLTKIESLIDSDKLDSASVTLKTICYNKLNEDKDKALYALLKTRIDILKYNTPQNDTLINQSLAYFLDNKENERICDCYYYKAQLEYSFRKFNIAFRDMYNAERYSNLTNNIKLKHKVCETLTIWNNLAFQYKTAEQYGIKNLKISINSGNKNWQAYAYLYLSNNYKAEHKILLAKQYIHKALKYINYVRKYDQAQFYLIMDQYSPEKCSQYFSYDKILQANPAPEIYSAVCINEYGKNNASYTDILEKVNREGSLELKIYTYEQLADLATSKNNFQQVCKFIAIKDSLKDIKYKQEQDTNALLIYKEYNYKIEQIRFWQKIMYAIYALLVIAFLIFIIYAIRRFICSRKREETLENQLLIQIYTEKLERLKQADADNATKSEAEEVNKKLVEYKDKQSRILHEGKQLYQDIQNGGNTLRWSKSDYENFIEYYKLIDLPFLVQVEANYEHLSPRTIFYLILDKEGKTWEQIEDIMVISSGAIRTMRTRIKSKKLTK